MNIRMTAQQSSVRGAALPATTIEAREGRFVWAFFALLICMLFSGASYAAEPYPSRAIRILVAYPPAGIADLSARLVAEGLRVKLNQPVIVENKPGANGVIGVRELVKSDPDGYTVMLAPSAFLINYAVGAIPSLDLMRDVVPIAGVAEYPTAMVVNKKMPVNSVQEFIAYAKGHSDELSFGSTGVGSLDWLAAELFMKQTGIRMVHVPYKGGPLALNDLLSGSIDVIIEVFPVVIEQIRSGAVKGLAVTSSYRLPSIPDVPTFDQAGVPNVHLTGWVGLYGPARLPEDIREQVGNAVVEMVKEPSMRDRFRAIGFEPTGQGVKAFTELHVSELKRWVAFLTELGLRN
jgi:tripartite-type tricarboxylate transporter receptor subunit TctC